MDGKNKGKKYNRQPSGAFKLLVLLLYGRYKNLHRLPRGIIQIVGIRALGVQMNVRAEKIRAWLGYLEDHGYLTSLSIAEDRRSAQFRVLEPMYVLSH